ncbi:MAG: hypothetical protein ING73_03165 [Rhodocyclaceae bacterium]|jgi:hypothetical protein|nr:hypothetical protein [Rhodocyclaceae bacterium]MCA3032544.1 hypothetical protein [Rhodocyclaceae bacterium]MCA3037473.1 hypothetical protein [Rhodocyclaceae bacterium]MCA3047285.1 hypothetical protein [Rhodocyclaceae bacterium]MCA3050867.1 hypothetical protein [Rhodocyclaceae bacterium]
MAGGRNAIGFSAYNMREDMYKVIVERPRKGSRMRSREGRLYRASEDVPHKQGMKQGLTNRKWLNENLAPLRRWLNAQVNRPWALVYAELCANIDRRNTVQDHIFAHISHFVEKNVRVIDGELYAGSDNWRGLVRIEDSYADLYVHPETGILRSIPKVSKAKRYQSRKLAEAAKLAQTRRKLTDVEYLLRLDGIWYHVTLPPPDAYKSDCSPSTETRLYLCPCDGAENLYAVRKRQLNKTELAKYQLKNAGSSRRFSFQHRPLKSTEARVEWHLLGPDALSADYSAALAKSAASSADSNSFVRTQPLTALPNFAIIIMLKKCISPSTSTEVPTLAPTAGTKSTLLMYQLSSRAQMKPMLTK